MLCYSLAKHARFCEPGVVTFPRRHLISLSKNLSKTIGENSWGSCQLRMLTLFSVIWSQIQFLVITDFSLGKETYRVYAVTQPERELLINRYVRRYGT